jgi:hypothetical protein
MIKFFRRVKNAIPKKNVQEPEWPPFDVNKQIEKIRQVESNQEIPLGQRIISIQYNYFELSLDREITGTYRLIVYEGNDRRFSFSIRCNYKEYEVLLKSFKEIIQFLDGDRRIKHLPNNEYLKGHYFGK